MHEIEWQVENGDIHTNPKGAEVIFWLNKVQNKRKIVIKYLSDPYYEGDSPVVEILLPDGKSVVVTIDSCIIKQD